MANSHLSRRTVLATAAIGATAGCTRFIEDSAPGDDVETVDGFEIETVAEGFRNPWGIAFLSEETLLLTERDSGDLALVDSETGDVTHISGTPDVDSGGQGGLLDVTPHPEFADNRWVYLTYSAANDEGNTATHLGRGRLDRDSAAFESFEAVYATEWYDSTQHYGSRVVFGEDDMVYLTTGDRGDKTFDTPEAHLSQQTDNAHGATVRLEPDGAVPDDNPFLDDSDVLDEIYSYGHRNAQGMTVHPETGDLWQSEHGENDGDELNIIEAGGDYGWPVTHTGCEYGTSDPLGERPEDREDIVNPVYYWECGTGGFPPAGMTVYDGDVFPDWQGDLFVGNLAGQYLGQFSVDGRDVEETGALLTDENWRIRDVGVGPDDCLYVVIDANNAPLVRLVPA